MLTPDQRKREKKGICIFRNCRRKADKTRSAADPGRKMCKKCYSIWIKDTRKKLEDRKKHMNKSKELLVKSAKRKGDRGKGKHLFKSSTLRSKKYKKS